MLNIPCIIFAGGKSSRMGEDKALLPFGGFKTLTQFQYERLSKIFTHVYISCKDKTNFDFDADYIEDENNNGTFAPTSGFTALFKALNATRVFVISVDSPFVNGETIKTLYDADRSSYDAVVAKTSFGVQPLCGIYHRSLQHSFQKMQKENNHKLGLLLKESNTHYLYFKDETPFLNLNHPHEYENALKLLKN